MDGLAIWIKDQSIEDCRFIYREGETYGSCQDNLGDILQEILLYDCRDTLVQDRSDEYPIVPKEFMKWRT